MNKKGLFTLYFLVVGIVIYGQQSNSGSIRIGLFTDIQYYDGPDSGSRHYRESLDKLPKILNKLNAEELNFMVDLGDRIDQKYESFNGVEEILKNSRHSIVFIPGNHDFSVAPCKKSKIVAKTGHPKGYHSKTIGNWQFIFLNGMDNSLIAHTWISPKYWTAWRKLKDLEEKKSPNAYDWNGGLGRKQLSWFKSQLETAKNKELHVVVFCHQPLFPGNAHNLWDYEELLNYFSNYTEEIWWISGHDHRGGYQDIDNLHLLTLKGMVEGSELSYGILELTEHTVNLLGFGNQLSLVDLQKKP